MGFKDHFSGHASSYAEFRPTYPDSLIRFLSEACVECRIAWDCATGNGQAARRLQAYFEQVIATDASVEQIEAAQPWPGVEFRVATAEACGIDARSVNLITVAQALHWFDIDAFLAEAARVLAPHGVLAVWSYERCAVGPGCDDVIDAIFAEVEAYWPSERTIVEGGYPDIHLPFESLSVPAFEMAMAWTADQALGYFRTWSASRRFQQARGSDPFAALEGPLREAWGDGLRHMRWPLTVKAARV